MVMKMIESRCGIICSECEFKSKIGCAGCINIEHPFWGEDFPCKLAKSYAYDEKQGDQGKRLEQCRCWGKIK